MDSLQPRDADNEGDSREKFPPAETRSEKVTAGVAGGAAVGAVLGLIVMPGMRSLIGATLGGMLGAGFANTSSKD